MLHLLFDKHAGEQSGLVDLLAERVQTLGGVSIAMAPQAKLRHVTDWETDKTCSTYPG